MTQNTEHTPPSPEERLEAIEYFLGQTLLALEADSEAIRTKLERLEQAIVKAAPQALPVTTEEEDIPPFTVDSLAEWMQICLSSMRKHQSATARQMVAIGELTDRVVAMGADPTESEQPPIGPAARAALKKAKQAPPRA